GATSVPRTRHFLAEVGAGSRRVHLASCTPSPAAAWVTQQPLCSAKTPSAAIQGWPSRLNVRASQRRSGADCLSPCPHGQDRSSPQRVASSARRDRCGTVRRGHVPTAGALAAKDLFLRRQLALFIPRLARPRRADVATRIALVCRC